ncbi:hypothetical protein B9G69_014925 [Bdellovibrio sp. SKB1291214]|uniref:coiled-coil domain-containing protein n=1 Tax=Bdellovibrio sp. SKB1291214 TaxID=1732569 RepID=UPI00113212B6|nr:hypothetical protein [Bdellovibrio sp. SKB1291214]UYL08333.1 hypothetical protein B9G69_014925 [Bdellovibrio sp. SKB1291214]
MFRYKGNTKGNAILQVLTAIAVMSISFYFLSTYVIAQRKQIVKTKNVVNLKFAVNSALDYVVFGIRQKYCFDDNTLLQNTTSCDWKHAGNVERLVMSDEQLQSLQAMVAAGTSIGPYDSLSTLRLDTIQRTLKFPVSSAHPLFPVVNSLKRVVDEMTGKEIPVKGISVTISRPENSGYLPKAGREVYVVAKVSLIDSGGVVIQIGSEPISVTSRLAIYPRELGSFALVLPGDLHMDKDWMASQVKAGDVMFHKYPDKKTIGTSAGMVFKSPVFVNGNIYLAKDTGNASTSNYSATTFADRVYMGNGWILNPDNSPYAPVSQGALPDRFWADSRVFGGFLRGIENDGLRDLGLDVLSGASSGSNGNEYNLNEICANLNLKSTELDSMEASNVKAALQDSSDGNEAYSRYRINLTNYNTFYAQKNALPAPTTYSKSGNAWKEVVNYSVNNNGKLTGAIASVEFGYGDGDEKKTFSMEMTKNGSFSLKPPVLNDQLYSNNKNEIIKQQKIISESSTISRENTAELAVLSSKIQAAQTEVDKVQDKLDIALNREKEPEVVVKPTVTPTATATASATATATATASPTATVSPTISPTATVAPTPTATASPSETVTPPSGGWYSQAEVDKLKAELATAKATLKKWQDQRDALEKADNTNTASIKDAQKVIESLSTYQSAYEKAKNAPPEIAVDLNKVYSWSGKEYKDRIDVEITSDDFQNLIDSKGNRISKFYVRFKMYDGTYYNSQPIRSTADANHLTGFLNFTVDSSGRITRPTMLSATSGTAGTEDDQSADMAARCEEYYNMINSQSFGAANWGVSFSSNTRKSWNFAGVTGSVTTDPILAEKKWTSNDTKFGVFSIVKNCIITKDVTFVTGFYTCDNLTIETRTQPLRIIGTFIIGKNMRVAPEAIKAGIVWSSIYWPQATPELRSRLILAPYTEPTNVAKCDKLPSPIWHPMPSIQETADRMACNVISLRAKADPFKWTAVDPDCGIPPGATQTVPTCKRRIYHYYVVEQAREGAGI